MINCLVFQRFSCLQSAPHVTAVIVWLFYASQHEKYNVPHQPLILTLVCFIHVSCAAVAVGGEPVQRSSNDKESDLTGWRQSCPKWQADRRMEREMDTSALFFSFPPSVSASLSLSLSQTAEVDWLEDIWLSLSAWQVSPRALLAKCAAESWFQAPFRSHSSDPSHKNKKKQTSRYKPHTWTHHTHHSACRRHQLIFPASELSLKKILTHTRAHTCNTNTHIKQPSSVQPSKVLYCHFHKYS